LKIRVTIRDRTPRVDVGAVIVGLPDLNESIAQRRSIASQNAAVQPPHLADRRRDVVVNTNQIVIQIEGHFVGVIRPDRLGGREDKLFGEKAALREKQGSETCGFEEFAAAASWMDH
jgi:hypothetical protein